MYLYASFWISATACIISCTVLGLWITDKVENIEDQLKKLLPGELYWPLTKREILKIYRMIRKKPGIMQDSIMLLQEMNTIFRVAIAMDSFFILFYIFTLCLDMIILLTFLRFSNRLVEEDRQEEVTRTLNEHNQQKKLNKYTNSVAAKLALENEDR